MATARTCRSNDAIKAAGSPDQINLHRVRTAFDESKWAAWNYLRLAATAGALLSVTGMLTTLKRT